MKNNRKITGYWIDRDYQGKFLLIYGGFSLFQILLFFYAINIIFNEVKLLSATPGIKPDEMLGLLSNMESNMYIIFGGAFILLLTVFLVVTFRFTHKTVGAIYRFRSTFDDIESTGEMKEIKLRNGDFFRDVEDSFNKMVKRIK